MSNSGVNKGFAKCFILFIAIIILLQGAVYLGLAIWGLKLSGCENKVNDVSSNPLKFAWDLIYFSEQECGVSVSIPVVGESVINIDWQKAEVITDRTHIFLITYAVVSGLWALTSLLVIVTICARVTNCIVGLCYWPWFLVVIAGSILDFVATIFFAKDIVHTTSLDSTIDYLGITGLQEQVKAVLNNFDSYFLIPAVIMTCLSSRVVLIWLLNIVGAAFCLSLARVLAKRTEPNTEEILVVSTAKATAKQSQNTYYDREVPSQSPTASTPQNFENRPSEVQPIQVVLIPQQSHSRQPSEQQLSDFIEPRVEMPVAKTPTAEINSATLNRQPSNVATLAANLDRQSHSPPPINEAGLISPHLALQSPLNNRYSGYDPYPPRVSAELRSQLPWSYTSDVVKPQPPPKPLPKAYPEIPEPDYASYPNKNDIHEDDAQHRYSRW